MEVRATTTTMLASMLGMSCVERGTEVTVNRGFVVMCTISGLTFRLHSHTPAGFGSKVIALKEQILASTRIVSMPVVRKDPSASVKTVSD